MPRIVATCCTALLLASLPALAGCDRGSPLYSVSGEVTFAGEPVAAGAIVFADAACSADAHSARIEAGRYALRTTPGDKTIRITATRETGKIIEGAMGVTYPETIDVIPPRYNTKTELHQTVAPQAGQVFDFRLDP